MENTLEGFLLESIFFYDELMWVFICLYRGGEVKIEVIEQVKVRIALLVFVTYSPCHKVRLKSAMRSMPLSCGIIF